MSARYSSTRLTFSQWEEMTSGSYRSTCATPTWSGYWLAVPTGSPPRQRGEVAALGLEGLFSNHRDRPYRGGRQKHWIKVKNRSHPAMSRELESSPPGFASGSRLRSHSVNCGQVAFPGDLS